MIQAKNVTTDRVWLREDWTDALEKLDDERKLDALLHSTPNGSAIGIYLKHQRSSSQHGCEPQYRFFYDARTRMADYVAVWAGLEQYPTAIRHTVENVSAEEAQAIDSHTASTLRWSRAQFGLAVAELEIERQARDDVAA